MKGLIEMDNSQEIELFKIILEIIEKTDADIKLTSEFNAFEFDSFTKVNIILAIEAFADCDEFDVDEFLLCDTYQELINIAMKMKTKLKD